MESCTQKTIVYGLFNIAAASGIVFANKYVFYVCGFNFPVALTWVHTLFTVIGTRVFASCGIFEVKKIEKVKVLPLALSYVAYIVLNNLSLQINTMSFYQIAKIAVAPTVMCMEVVFLKKYPSWQVVGSVLIVCVGVFLSTVNDTQVGTNPTGMAVGFAAVICTALYQLWVGSKQKEFGMGSNQLLHQYTPLAAAALGMLVPILEPVGIQESNSPVTLIRFPYTLGAVVAIFISAALGVLVSLSTFLFIGVTSSLTYNVVGHIKTVIILTGSYILFDDNMSQRKLLGISIAMGGIILYSLLKLKAAQQPICSKQVEEKQLLVDQEDGKDKLLSQNAYSISWAK